MTNRLVGSYCYHIGVEKQHILLTSGLMKIIINNNNKRTSLAPISSENPSSVAQQQAFVYSTLKYHGVLKQVNHGKYQGWGEFKNELELFSSIPEFELKDFEQVELELELKDFE